MLNTMAKRIARSQNPNPNQQAVFIDPASIMMYITIITEIVKCVKRYRDSKDIPEAAAQPTRFETAVVKRVVRRHVGWKRYRREGGNITKAVFEVAAGSTPEEIAELYQEV